MSQHILHKNASDPDSPTGTAVKLYCKGDGLYIRDSAGGPTLVSTFGGTSSVTSLKNILFVSKETQTSPDGSLSKPYESINDAISNLTTEKAIMVAPGLYPESPITLPEGVDLISLGSRRTVTIQANNASQPMITAEGNQKIQGFTIKGVTSSSGIYFNQTDEKLDISDLSFDQCQTGLHCTAGIIIGKQIGTVNGATITDLILLDGGDMDIGQFNCITTSSITNVIHVTNSNSTLSIDYPEILGTNITNAFNIEAGNVMCTGARIRDVDNGLYLSGTGKLHIDGVFIFGAKQKAIWMEDSCELSVLGAQIIESVQLDWFVNSPNCKLFITSHITNTNKLYIHPLFVNEIITAIDLKPDDEGFKVYSKLTVGRPNKGSRTAFGEGDSYNWGTYFYTFDGTTFVDVTTNLLDPDDSNTVTLPNTNVNTALYIATRFIDSSTALPLPFYGCSLHLTQAAVGGSLVWEYYDGVGWSEIRLMGTTNNANHLPVAENIFYDTVSKKVRFCDKINNDWAPNDPVSVGTNHKWIRVRITSALTTSFTLDQVKLYPSRTEIDADGFVEFFGKARPIKALPINFGNFLSASASPSGSDIYLDDDLGVGMDENVFVNNTIDRTGFTFFAPLDIDTSCPVRLRVAFQLWADTTGTNNIRFYVRIGYVNEGGSVYLSTGSAPSNDPTKVTILHDVQVNGNQYDYFTTLIEVPVNNIVSERLNAESGDLMFITLERDSVDSADTFENSITVCNLIPYYTAWRLGGHLNNWSV